MSQVFLLRHNTPKKLSSSLLVIYIFDIFLITFMSVDDSRICKLWIHTFLLSWMIVGNILHKTRTHIVCGSSFIQTTRMWWLYDCLIIHRPEIWVSFSTFWLAFNHHHHYHPLCESQRKWQLWLFFHRLTTFRWEMMRRKASFQIKFSLHHILLCC